MKSGTWELFHYIAPVNNSCSLGLFLSYGVKIKQQYLIKKLISKSIWIGHWGINKSNRWLWCVTTCKYQRHLMSCICSALYKLRDFNAGRGPFATAIGQELMCLPPLLMVLCVNPTHTFSEQHLEPQYWSSEWSRTKAIINGHCPLTLHLLGVYAAAKLAPFLAFGTLTGHTQREAHSICCFVTGERMEGLQGRTTSIIKDCIQLLWQQRLQSHRMLPLSTSANSCIEPSFLQAASFWPHTIAEEEMRKHHSPISLMHSPVYS